MTFGQRLKALLDLRGYSARGFSGLTAVSSRYISMILSGEREEPSLSIALSIAQALDVSLDWLATGETREPEELTPEEQDVIERLRRASPQVREMVLRSIRGMLPRDEEE